MNYLSEKCVKFLNADLLVIIYLGDPSEETNVCNVSSQIPRSAKYNKVENNTTQVTVKKNKAERASPDLLKAIIMTSIVITIAFEYL
jgi:multisubunit Na+/H+ antiporter MnhC subunit